MSSKNGGLINMSCIHPVLLAGGSGTRLWPLSRKSYPKQFSNLIGKRSLFQESALRLTSSDIIKFNSPITLTNSNFRFIVSEQLQDVKINQGPILIEPDTKNTAPAILAASVFSCLKDEDTILLVAPSDHLIPSKTDFHQAIKVGLSYVQNGKMVTFGIEPTDPTTSYGYIEISTKKLDRHGTSKVSKFVEKPNTSIAKQMLESGQFLWNAGIFLFKAKDMVNAFKDYAPEMLDIVKKAVEMASADLDFLRLAPSLWSKLEDISIDYAIMEKARNLVAVPYKSKWSDLGGWDSVWLESIKDPSGNAISGSAHMIDCSNTLLRSEGINQQVMGLGLENILAIAMPDAVLVAHKDRAEDVKKAVDLLKEKEIPQAQIFPKEHRPWGWFESLAIGNSFQVKRISVKPSAALSLQSHKYRSEHWIVVQGRAKVTIDGKVKLLMQGQSIYVPLGSKHRLENYGEKSMVLIEVQIGSYLGEDDIVRYEDLYARK